MARDDVVIEVERVVTRFGAQTVHDGVSFTVRRGTLVALIGGSGTGKSVLLREIIGLQRPTEGRIRLLGTDVWSSTPEALDAVRRRFGMMFQDGALFSSLTVAQNVAVPLIEHASVPPDLLEPLIRLRLAQAGLRPRRGGEDAQRAVGRHAQAGGDRAGAGARTRGALPRRADLRASTPPRRAVSTRWSARWSTTSGSPCSS